MATHDYVIANQSGASFRTDLNNALAAIVSNNSNSSSPATTYAYQWWADTSAGVLKIRNSANNAWIELLQLDGTLTLEDGSASTPALAFRDDLDTGIFSGGANEFNIATGGTERFVIDSSGNCGIGSTSPSTKLDVAGNMIFSSGNPQIQFNSGGPIIQVPAANELRFLNSSTNEIMRITGTGLGIGTTSPSQKVQIAGDSGNACLSLLRSNAASNDNAYGHVFFENSSDAVLASISGRRESAADDAFLQFNTQTTGGSITERLRITSSGKVGIGTTSPSTNLDVNGNILLSAGLSQIQFNAGGPIIQVPSANTLRFLNSSTAEVYRIDSSGNLLHQHTGTAASVAEASSGNGGISLGQAGNGIFLGLNSGTHGCIFNRISGSGSMISFRFAGSDKGSIVVDSSATAFNTSSDYRLKENAVAISDGITRIKTLKPYRFNFKSESSKTVDGFFAHEVTAVPEAITGTKDGVDSDNNPIYQQIDQSKLVPLLVAAVKELITKVEALEAS